MCSKVEPECLSWLDDPHRQPTSVCFRVLSSCSLPFPSPEVCLRKSSHPTWKHFHAGVATPATDAVLSCSQLSAILCGLFNGGVERHSAREYSVVALNVLLYEDCEEKWTYLRCIYLLRIKDGEEIAGEEVTSTDSLWRKTWDALPHTYGKRGGTHGGWVAHWTVFESLLTVNKLTVYSFHKLRSWVPHSTLRDNAIPHVYI